VKDNDYIERAKLSAFERLSFEQIAFIEGSLECVKRSDIALAVGISETQLKRAAKYSGWKFTFAKGFTNQKYDAAIIGQVIDFYDKYGKRKTQKHFLNVNVRSIVEKYGAGRNTRCHRWTNENILDLLRMAGVISKGSQAKYFNRPLANEGSIISVWQKVLKCRPICINGLPEYKAKYIVKESCPKINLGYNRHNIYLWTDCSKHLRDDCSIAVEKAVAAMADFQSKLFKDPRRDIEKIIKERR